VSIHRIKPSLLVIGGTGFVGYHLSLKAIKKGWKVTSVSTNKPKKHRYLNKVNYLKIDIADLKKLEKKLVGSFDYVVNLGGYVDHRSFENGGEKIIKVHFTGVVNLTKIISRKRIKKFVQVGSSAEYGNCKAPQNENQDGQPISPYALAKLASTNFLLMLNKNNNFPVCVLRFFQIYGPKQDQNRVVPKAIQSCLKNRKFAASKGDQIRDFCFIDDAVDAIFLALKSRKSNGEIFNIGFGKAIKIKKAINTIQQIIGLGTIDYGKIKYRKDENMSVYPNINKAVSKLKWKPKINFNQGAKISINSFKKKYG
tara:strand:- start:723 stop:1655 length:933 start_codon:yes stop_codon:yes gene_type:complete